MATRNNGKPKQMSEANESESEPPIVPLKLPSGRIVNMLSSNNNGNLDVKGSDVKKRKRSPCSEDQDDGTDVQDVPTANDSGSTHSKDASSDSEAHVHHFTDYTVRSRYGEHRNQHVRSQSWEESSNESYDPYNPGHIACYLNSGEDHDMRPTYNEFFGHED